MNSNTLKLKIVVVIMFLFAFSSLSSLGYASEVTGNLSSSGNHSTGNDNQNDPPQEEEEENLSGSVASPTSTSGGGSSSSSRPASQNGSVLGASTYSPPSSSSSSPSPENNSYVYPTRGALTAGNSAGTGAYAAELAQLPAIEENAEIGQTLPSLTPMETEDSGIGSWFWIILISLLLIGVVGYFYSRPVDRMQSI